VTTFEPIPAESTNESEGTNVGHLGGLLATGNALFLADMSSTGALGSHDAGRGVIYKVVAAP
jgi:hypothetical protein